MKKIKLFKVDYIRQDEPENNYHRELPPNVFLTIYTGFEHFGKRAAPGDSAMLTLGLEKWEVRAF